MTHLWLIFCRHWWKWFMAYKLVSFMETALFTGSTDNNTEQKKPQPENTREEEEKEEEASESSPTTHAHVAASHLSWLCWLCFPVRPNSPVLSYFLLCPSGAKCPRTVFEDGSYNTWQLYLRLKSNVNSLRYFKEMFWGSVKTIHVCSDKITNCQKFWTKTAKKRDNVCSKVSKVSVY